MADNKEYLDFDGLSVYDELIKAYIKQKSDELNVKINDTVKWYQLGQKGE